MRFPSFSRVRGYKMLMQFLSVCSVERLQCAIRSVAPDTVNNMQVSEDLQSPKYETEVDCSGARPRGCVSLRWTILAIQKWCYRTLPWNLIDVVPSRCRELLVAFGSFRLTRHKTHCTVGLSRICNIYILGIFADLGFGYANNASFHDNSKVKLGL